jgi:hypothetical protein
LATVAMIVCSLLNGHLPRRRHWQSSALSK